MTNKELFMKIFGISEGTSRFAGCDGLICPVNVTCSRCTFHNFWEQEVDLGKIYANISTNDLGKLFHKAILNSLYGRHIGKTIICKDTDSTVLKEAFRNASTSAVFPMNKPIEDEWTEVPASLLADEVHYIAEILDDATVHGLDFKYENGKYYFKDKQDVPN